MDLGTQNPMDSSCLTTHSLACQNTRLHIEKLVLRGTLAQHMLPCQIANSYGIGHLGKSQLAARHTRRIASKVNKRQSLQRTQAKLLGIMTPTTTIMWGDGPECNHLSAPLRSPRKYIKQLWTKQASQAHACIKHMRAGSNHAGVMKKLIHNHSGIQTSKGQCTSGIAQSNAGFIQYQKKNLRLLRANMRKSKNCKTIVKSIRSQLASRKPLDS